MLKAAIVSNELPPYRVPMFERLAEVQDISFQNIFCTKREPNRHWELPPLKFDHLFLKDNFIERNGRYIHNNPDVVRALKRFAPDVVITCGFNPTHLYAFAYAVFSGLPHVAMTDGSLQSEQGLSNVHRRIRRIVYGRTKAYIYASDGGLSLYESYGIEPRRCFKSCLCVDNTAFSNEERPQEKKFDFIFCGRIDKVKNPFFALRVAIESARRLHRQTSILFVGTGTEEERLKAEAANNPDLVSVSFQGFTLHSNLPSLYHSARLFLFPTQWDPWGVVVNEACAAGVPPIVSPYCGAAGELVHDGECGFVCGFNENLWADKAALLLTQAAVYKEFSRRAVARVRDYSYDNAATGIASACRLALAEQVSVAHRMN